MGEKKLYGMIISALLTYESELWNRKMAEDEGVRDEMLKEYIRYDREK